ncbi:MAG: asparaginase [Hydrogenophaga sp.]|nr:asparaginase [Hydrogenophaga sp.]MDP2074262.1 asparaginase [Hydrogenophaga sp.]MDP2986367.1 asparaginase [Hydrogenophaga sp.]MDP3108351.1 asparaginase [Hydrogenophaga sp.]
MVNANQARRLVVLGTGGTIAGRATQVSDNVGYVAGQVAVSELVAMVPALAACPLDVEQVAQINSKDMVLGVWQTLAGRVAVHLERSDVAGIVITHGTDTIEETAFLLQTLLKPSKPVVLTCAMRPATALVPDGPQNLSDAVAVALHPQARGVVVVCAGRIHGAIDVAKVHPYRTDPFDSGDAGALGCVEEAQLRMFRPWPQAVPEGTHDTASLQRLLGAAVMPRVELIFSHALADGEVVRALLGHTSGAGRLRGIVVAGTGNGTVHDDLLAALKHAQSSGVEVVVASRCAQGRVVPHAGQPLPDSAGLSPVKARLALALRLLEV